MLAFLVMVYVLRADGLLTKATSRPSGRHSANKLINAKMENKEKNAIGLDGFLGYSPSLLLKGLGTDSLPGIDGKVQLCSCQS